MFSHGMSLAVVGIIDGRSRSRAWRNVSVLSGMFLMLLAVHWWLMIAAGQRYRGRCLGRVEASDDW